MTSPDDAKQDTWRLEAERALHGWIAARADTICPAEGVSKAGWWYAGWRARETEIERLRQREVSCRECGEAVECGDVVFHEECLDPAIIAARAALRQGEDGSG